MTAPLGSTVDLVQETLLELMEAHKPADMLVVSASEPPCLWTWLDHGNQCDVTALVPDEVAERLPGLGRFEYALVTDALEYMTVPDATAMLARLRDVHCHRFATTCIQGHEGWEPGRFMSLALTLHRRIRQDRQAVCVYTHDIDTYSRERDWNTPENWAHPGNFRRYRW